MQIRKLQKSDIDRVADIWLNANLNAHYFIPSQYWNDNFEPVKDMLPQAEVMYTNVMEEYKALSG